MLLFVFGFTLDWLPMYHGFSSSVSGWIVGMRNNMINTLGEDYVVFAEAKGISGTRLIFSHAARNALLPQVTGLAIANFIVDMLALRSP